MQQGVAQYRAIQANTTDPKSLLLLLYDKIILELQRSSLALQNSEEARPALIKANLGVLELMRTLDWQAHPQLAESLHNLYSHILLQLGEAFKGDLPALQRAEDLLNELRATWREAVRQDAQRNEKNHLQRAKAV